MLKVDIIVKEVGQFYIFDKVRFKSIHIFEIIVKGIILSYVFDKVEYK